MKRPTASSSGGESNLAFPRTRRGPHTMKHFGTGADCSRTSVMQVVSGKTSWQLDHSHVYTDIKTSRARSFPIGDFFSMKFRLVGNPWSACVVIPDRDVTFRKKIKHYQIGPGTMKNTFRARSFPIGHKF